MQIELAKQTLGYLWPIVAIALERPLDEMERNEVRRLCGLLRQASEDDPRFCEGFERLCVRVLSCSEAHTDKSGNEAEALLDEIERVWRSVRT